MRDKYFYEVMFDDTSIDVSKEVGLVWSIANSLRGAYTSDKYKDVIIPMVIIRRFECALEETKDAVVAKYKLVLCQEKVQIKYALLMLSYPAKASALSSNAA